MMTPAGDRSRRTAERPSRVLLTGGTGFLGSHLAAALLERGYRVTLLARSRNGTPPGPASGGSSIGSDSEKGRGRGSVSEAISRPGLGLAAAEAARLAAATDEIFHCASDTSFADRRRAEIEATNIGGLGTSWTCRAASSFHLVSTAYVAGKTSGCVRSPGDPAAFFNAYEETKCRAEGMARARCRAGTIRLTIYRPSVVCGDSRTGRSLLFNAVITPSGRRSSSGIRSRSTSGSGGGRAAAMGVTLESDGSRLSASGSGRGRESTSSPWTISRRPSWPHGGR